MFFYTFLLLTSLLTVWGVSAEEQPTSTVKENNVSLQFIPDRSWFKHMSTPQLETESAKLGLFITQEEIPSPEEKEALRSATICKAQYQYELALRYYENEDYKLHTENSSCQLLSLRSRELVSEVIKQMIILNTAQQEDSETLLSGQPCDYRPVQTFVTQCLRKKQMQKAQDEIEKMLDKKATELTVALKK